MYFVTGESHPFSTELSKVHVITALLRMDCLPLFQNTHISLLWYDAWLVNNRSPVQILVRPFLMILFLLQDFLPILLSWSIHQRQKCGKKTVTFVQSILFSTDRVQTKLNFTNFLQSLSYEFMRQTQVSIWSKTQVTFKIGSWSTKSITCLQYPDDVSNTSEVFCQSQLYYQPSLIWIHDRGQISILSNLRWPWK